MDITEKRFETDIENYLIEHGYIKGNQINYSKDKSMDLEELIAFISETQPKEFERYKKVYQSEFKEKLYKRINESINTYGLIYVLRHGIEDRGIKLKLIYFSPKSNLNSELIDKYHKNKFSCIRQFKYSSKNENSIDMVISINGIPLIAIELKNQLTGQNISNAKHQFMFDRDYHEQCFGFDKRFLVYFAVDLYEIAMCTELKGKETFFLPFNQGSNGAGQVGLSGNPTNERGYVTSYLWEKILSKNMLLDILQKYIHIEIEKKKVYENGKENIKVNKKLIFPRYHQLDVVKKIVNQVKLNKKTNNYLIQHSAGSGKSNSIAWLAYELSSLHDINDNPMYNSIIIVTDRKILDSQLQDTIFSFDHTKGTVEKIDEKKSSKDLKIAINSGKRIIITTLQKFPVIYEDLDEINGKKFAIIIDEAHSSQTGSSAKKMKSALADTEESLKEYLDINSEDSEYKTNEDLIIDEILSHGQHKNLSYFAFTATPKQKTLEMFGDKMEDGKFVPFHIYSMKQAIDEGFIHDVLKNYMTYKECWKIAKSTPDNPELPISKAVKAVRRYESLHPHNLAQKTAIIIETYRDITKNKINGRGKAMVVTASRLHAVRYYHEFKNYLEMKKYDDIEILIAFSGVIRDNGVEYTEENLNIRKDETRIKENQLAEEFHKDEYSMLIVADKYQTGFDEPLLHTMFVDKKLSGVKAVQTLSRLNRTCRGKNDTFVLDFVNEKTDIKDAFEPYFEVTKLDEEINVNLIYETKNKLHNFKLYNEKDIVEFCNMFTKNKVQNSNELGQLVSYLKPIVNRYNDLDNDNKYEFRRTLNNFNKWYSYITQITRMFDVDLQKEYYFTQYLIKLLPKNNNIKEIFLEDKLKLEFYKLEATFNGSIELAPTENESTLENIKSIDVGIINSEEDELLESIINKVNTKYDGAFSEQDRVIIETIYNKCVKNNKKLESYATNNDEEVFNQSIFPEIFKKVSQECYMESMKAFSKLFENKEFYETIMMEISKQAYKDLRSGK